MLLLVGSKTGLSQKFGILISCFVAYDIELKSFLNIQKIKNAGKNVSSFFKFLDQTSFFAKGTCFQVGLPGFQTFFFFCILIETKNSDVLKK